MKKEQRKHRPDFDNIRSRAEFNCWYWLKEEMIEISKRMGLPTTARKFDLQDRTMCALDGRVYQEKTAACARWLCTL